MKHATFEHGRISALSDGVFAIAMTLLVLDLQLPDVGSVSEPSAFLLCWPGSSRASCPGC